jgi:lysophospholipase L1-like esterase
MRESGPAGAVLRKQIFVIVAVLLSTLVTSVVCAGAYLLLQRPDYHMLGGLRELRFVRAYLFDRRLRRLARALRESDPRTDLFKTMWDTNAGVMLSRRLYRVVDMDGRASYGYKPNLHKLSFWTAADGLSWRMETEDTPALRAALADLGPELLLTASYDDGGFRRTDPDLAVDCQAHVLFLGDSFTDGLWVADTDTFANRYARVARARSGMRVCPVNAGVNGYGSFEERFVLEHEFEHAGRPPLVFVMYFPNDVDQNYDAVVDGTLPDADRPWRESLDELRRMKRFADARGITLVLAAIPTSTQAIEGLSQAHYQDALRRFAAAERIVFVNLIEGFTARGPRKLYLPGDPHFTPLGHQVTAELLYDATQDRLR